MPSDSHDRFHSGRVLLGAACAFSLIAGCAAPAPQPAPPPAPVALPAAPPPPAPPPVTSVPVSAPEATVIKPVRPRNGPLDQLLAHADRVRSLPQPELLAEIARLGDPDDSLAQVELALVLLQTRAPVDTARALGLLQRAQSAASADARAVQPLVRLLVARAAEQRRLEDQIDKQNQQLRDNQRRLDQLNERLEAMRAIERSLTAPRAPGASAAPAGSHGNGARPAP